MNFENPRYLIFLLAIPVYVLLRYGRFKILHNNRLPFSRLSLISVRNNRFAFTVNLIKEILLLVVIVSLTVALARPRGGSAVTTENILGVDIVLLTDISGSMAFIDNPPSNARRVNYLGQERFVDTGGDLISSSRLEVAKRVMQNYIDKQDFNRIGLVLFSSYALTKAPLSTDKELLKSVINETTYFDEKNTAVGTGILTALNRVRHSTAKSKAIILLTDGINNTGIVDPITAANTARELGVTIYTVGLGNTGGSLQPIDAGLTTYVYRQGRDFDPEVLQEIADITGGKFFEASSEDTLQNVYDEIDSLEKSEISVKRRVLYEEQFKPWLYLASVLLGMWLLLNALILKIP